MVSNSRIVYSSCKAPVGVCIACVFSSYRVTKAHKITRL
ncbi:hypothetical protein APHWI1_0789 [Anaplasma phagocytophilum str. ApWI1]|uniref:Uncharacterized protein n=2 Tax=Anaplasma phagocytophilum TaxID=948 RepID=A0A0F3MV62_ANAPH|nr:hypothetical protein EPHNCH_1616 [Anaplasma phagocytophilum str. NCH-1]KJV59876.1 hypothetical protein APHWEB_0730 [Anaplasma phagocytophilum str. Webster]KJV85588.1 hypothetical protein APHWI1_0789 [Anaplasma phagocytophilum str. ApWI1]KJV87134.1 hypothetical protein APHNYW_1294 [Anaplasma phagocytophilum str. ApNYW]KJZ99470.1 hypothetical protein APHCR_0766 [Anaplasma phagocytophilum str. CR1007]KKA00649.1 hypothetical protein APHDU1_0558 [Anaplasma phagocytophilum]